MQSWEEQEKDNKWRRLNRFYEGLVAGYRKVGAGNWPLTTGITVSIIIVAAKRQVLLTVALQDRPWSLRIDCIIG